MNLARSLVGLFNRARLGFSRHLFSGAGGIGDDLLCTAVFRELRKRGARDIGFATKYPDLVAGNADVDHVIYHPRPWLNYWLRQGLPLTWLGYAHHNIETDQDDPPTEPLLAKICRLAGLEGEIDLRPYLFLNHQEMAAGKLAPDQIAIQSSGVSAAFYMRNKEWFPDRFQEVCSHLAKNHTVVQIGSTRDPKLEGAIDLRGRTTLRESAAILANSHVFIGLVGFLMHLARAVNCRSVIIYGGRETPDTTGYIANSNLVGQPSCSPCWLRNRCDYDHVCMRMIPTEAAIEAVQNQISKGKAPLEIERFTLSGTSRK